MSNYQELLLISDDTYWDGNQFMIEESNLDMIEWFVMAIQGQWLPWKYLDNIV